ncbi:MAG: MFS transporter, partial [Gemmatimonadetes bacterium]|nr:MFS transporter [Gemmatimonadota bacterium]
MSAVGTAESRAGPKLPRAVYLFGATSLANDLASEMIYPLLPAFVTRTLGGGALTLGILDGLADAVAAALKLVSGYLAERARLRAPLVVAGYAIAAATRPLVAVAGAAWHVIGLRTADRVGKGLRTAPRDLLIADVAPPEARGRAFGLHRAADHTGAVMGPLVSAALIAGGLGVRTVFWIAAIPGAVAVALAWGAVRAAGMRRADLRSAAEPSDADRHPARADRRPPDEGHRPDHPLRRRVAGEGDGAQLVPLIGVLAAAAFLRAPETLLILRAQDLGIGVAAVPILWAGLHVVRSGSSYPGGVLADRWGARRTLAVGWLAYAGLAVAFALAESRLHA